MGKLKGAIWIFYTIISKFILKYNNVDVGGSVRFLGVPIVSMVGNSVIQIGDRSVVCSKSWGTALGVRGPVVMRTLTQGAELIIGEDCGLSGTVICAANSVTIGDRCLVGADVKIFDTDFHSYAADNRRYAAPDWGRISAPVEIGDDVFLGTGSIICKGTKIGRGAIIGAGSIVTRDVPAFAIVAGNPAKIIRFLDGESIKASPSVD